MQLLWLYACFCQPVNTEGYSRAVVIIVCVAVSQSDVIRKYGLTSVTLDKFFLGPLPDFRISGSNQSTIQCSPVAGRLPAVNGCLILEDLYPVELNGAAIIDDGVIDLTEDDVEVPTVRTSSGVAVKKHVERKSGSVSSKSGSAPSKSSSAPKNHKKKAGRLTFHNDHPCMLQVPPFHTKLCGASSHWA